MSPPVSSFNAAKAKSTSTFLSAFVISASVAGIQLLIFLLLRTSIKKIYAPRTYLPIPSKRSQPVSSAPWGWLLPTIRAPSVQMIPTAGLDAFMYLRFLKMMIYIFAPTTCLTFLVLLPLDAVDTNVSATGLNSFSFGNIRADQQIRYIGHLLCAYAVTFWVIYLIQKEMSNYVKSRQKFLTSQYHIDLPQSRTVLVTGVPKKYLSKNALKKLTRNLPGGIKSLWISRELKNLPKLYEDRLKYTSLLESAETKLSKIALKHHKSSKRNHQSQNSIPTSYKSQLSHESSDDDPINKLVAKKFRPTHRLGFWGLIGKKVDTVNWCKDEIVRLTKEIENERKQLDDHPPHNSAFIEFNDRLAAQIFSQIVLHQQPLRMAKRYVDAAPEDIIWDNLNINPYDERVRNLISWVLTLGLVVLWSFPVAFIGSLSNITSLCTTVSWLHWLCNTSTRLQDVIQGILPPVLLALIFLILPMILRLIGRYSGVPRISEIELILMTRYYIFLVVHGFVVTTLSSGLTAAIPALSKDPGQAVTILTQNLPKASIFFMTYMVTTSLTSASGALLQVFDLILYYLKLFVFASTPRSVFDIRYTMSRPQFGTLFPNTTLLATIGLAYSIIAPVMTILALLAFSVYWLAYKYLFLFTFDIPPAHETGGRFFPLAMNHVFIGLYVSQICLTGLFFLARNSNGEPSSIAEGSLMIILIVVTFFCHLLIRNSYAPLTMFVPLSMIDELREEEEKLLGSYEEDHKDHQQHIESVTSHSNPNSPDSPTSPNSSNANHINQNQENFDQLIPKYPKQNKSKRPISVKLHSSNSILPAIRPDGLKNRQSSTIRVEDNYVEQGRTAFIHPAVWERTRTIWIAEDPMGVAKLEMEDMKRRNIPVSMVGAGMSESGKVFVTRSPPETAEVIEIERHKTEGIFALPGAIGEVAKYAGGKIGEKVLNSTTIGKSVTNVGGHMRTASRATAGSTNSQHKRNRSLSTGSSSQNHHKTTRNNHINLVGNNLKQKFKNVSTSGLNEIPNQNQKPIFNKVSIEEEGTNYEQNNNNVRKYLSQAQSNHNNKSRCSDEEGFTKTREEDEEDGNGNGNDESGSIEEYRLKQFHLPTNKNYHNYLEEGCRSVLSTVIESSSSNVEVVAHNHINSTSEANDNNDHNIVTEELELVRSSSYTTHRQGL
ncbi:hypothetical protein CROQUDRAFT_74529 [Cronartium quercuum f. sp. fusiforme G11]|uniref:DUF221-domain-containing protein n=1 Tax=Cronartium quercuum f. sp. fusiforme G11 TaxID=708437 RepID=A0A9P6TE87_9BASI|nr:hypothetical protein CROQUDRAFT_74529 [Cronartium quercuum f. sp. fusiforme G11]